jgi:hypothetical protein
VARIMYTVLTILNLLVATALALGLAYNYAVPRVAGGLVTAGYLEPTLDFGAALTLPILVLVVTALVYCARVVVDKMSSS